MKGLRVDVDGTVDLIDLPAGDSALLDALRNAIGGGYVERVRCGEIGRYTTKAEHPDRTLAMWLDDEGALGASGLQVNLLVNGLMSVLGLQLAQNLYGPVVFTETDEEEGLTLGLQKVTSRLLQGILHRLTIDNLDILAEVNRARKYTAVVKDIGVEVLDTSDSADVRQIGLYRPDPEGQSADALLEANGWERTAPWESAAWLYEGEPTTELSAPIRKK